MSSTPKPYRKKPVVIEAMEWDGTAPEATLVIDWALSHGVTINYYCIEDCRADKHTLLVSTLEGSMSASPGDFIIKGVQGEFYPCKPDIFKATYEEVK